MKSELMIDVKDVSSINILAGRYQDLTKLRKDLVYE